MTLSQCLVQVTPLTSMCVSEHDESADYWHSSACVITLLFGTQVCAVITLLFGTQVCAMITDWLVLKCAP